MKFTKMQGAGNDFIVMKPENIDLNWPQIARRMCDRRFGIGGDGIILVLPSTVADIRMRIFNADGSEAETCGNGLRCISKFAVLNNLVEAGTEKIRIETIPGINRVQLIYRGLELARIQVNMGIPKLKAAEIPVKIDNHPAPILDYGLNLSRRKLQLSFVSMGNPHAVFFIKERVQDFPLLEIGPQVENHALFPKRINFEVARVTGRHQIEMRVWERGAGETLACGSGACAVAVAARLHGFIDDEVDITLPGGVLNVQWDGKGEVLMSGPAEIVFTGEWPE